MTLEQPDSRPIPRGYRLHDPYSYEWKHDEHRYRIDVPRGFEYDGASVPRLVWTITGIRPDGLLRAAALIHDWLYAHGGDLPAPSFLVWRLGDWQVGDGLWRRKHADRMFGRLMREAQVPWFKRRAAYWAVRFFGWKTWWLRRLRRYRNSRGSFLA